MMHIHAEYTVEWKCPATWQGTDFYCEVERAGGLNHCAVRRQSVAGDVLEMSGGPVFAQNERQIIRLYTLANGGKDYLFCVDLHGVRQAGEVSDWMIARTSKLANTGARRQFFRNGDPGGFLPAENPTVTMRYKITSIERQRGRQGGNGETQ
jgi:hypothetical protein